MAEFRPKLPRVIGAELLVPSKSDRYTLIGSAFDYLLRFEIGRRSRNVIEKRWIASIVAAGMRVPLYDSMMDDFKTYCESRADFHPDALRDQSEFIALAESAAGSAGFQLTDPYQIYAHRAIRTVVEEARADVTEYRTMSRPSRGEQKQVAFQAIRLAKLDSVLRAGRLDPTFEKAERYDIDELVELLDIVPWTEILQEGSVLLNPTLGTSTLGIGADADLIVGACLIDIKTSERTSMDAEWLDQLLCYLLLARYDHRMAQTLPIIESLGIYFARHGCLWRQNARLWTERPQFLEIEEWFLQQLMTSETNADVLTGTAPPMEDR
jgi:hypothetical protein